MSRSHVVTRLSDLVEKVPQKFKLIEYTEIGYNPSNAKLPKAE